MIRKNSLIFLSLLYLSACQNWKQIHVLSSSSVQHKINKIYIYPPDDIPDLFLYNALLDQQSSVADYRPYELRFTINTQFNNQSVLTDNIMQVNFTVAYTLENDKQKQKFQKKISTSYPIYDSTTIKNDLASELNTKNAMNILAERMIQQLMLFFKQQPNW